MTSSPMVLRQAVTIAMKLERADKEFAVKKLERLARFPNERDDAERMLADYP